MVEGLIEVRGHRGTLFQVRGNEILSENGKTSVGECANTKIIGKLFVVRLVFAWN